MKALIIDDEKLVRESIKALLETYCPEIECVSVTDSLHEASLSIEHFHPDIIFLDIHIYESDGLSLLSSFPERPFKTVIISGDANRAIDAIKLGVSDYLLKPVNIFELQQAVKKVLHEQSNRHKLLKISVPDGQGYKLLSPSDIIRIEAHSNYSKIYLAGKQSITTSKTLKSYEDSLASQGFFRPHKSHLVNMACITGYSKSQLELYLGDSTVVPVSRQKLNELMRTVTNVGNNNEQ